MRDRVLVGLIVAGLVANIIGGAWMITQVAGFAEDLRDSSVAGCKRQNEVRSAERHGLRNDIRESVGEIAENKRIPPEFFPGIPPEQFEALIKQGIRQARENIAEDRRVIDGIPPADCEDAYPSN
jgi:hypothetical protein